MALRHNLIGYVSRFLWGINLQPCVMPVHLALTIRMLKELDNDVLSIAVLFLLCEV